jgi:hypothetical protein
VDRRISSGSVFSSDSRLLMKGIHKALFNVNPHYIEYE